MTQREARAAPSLRAGTADESIRRAEAAPSRVATPDDRALWDLCANMTAEERKELLGLARRQGLLYAHQLPHQNGAKSPPTPSRWQKLLKDVHSGQVDALPSAPHLANPFDSELDATQRDAVSKALASPDICLIAGLPGTGKSRVVQEIVRQAAERGERVLLLAPRAAPVDRIVEAVAGADGIFPLRLREHGESPPTSVSRFLFAECHRQLRDGTFAYAVKAKARAEERCRAHPHERQCWPELRRLAEEIAQVGIKIRELGGAAEHVSKHVRERVAALQQAPAQGGDALAEKVLQELHALKIAESALAAKEDEYQTLERQCQTELSSLSSQIQRCQAVIDARTQGRWWTMQWWRALLSAGTATQLGELQAKRQDAESRAGNVQRQHAELLDQRKELQRSTQEKIGRLEQEEVERQQSELASRREELEREAARLRGLWEQIVARIQHEHCRPAQVEGAAIDGAFQAWQQQLGRDEQACQFANQWASFLQDTLDNLGEKMVRLCNLVAGTLKALDQDRQAAEGMHGSFDLLILEEAHDVAEEDFLRAAAHARRTILIGEPTWLYEAQAKSVRTGPAPNKPNQARVLEALWQRLHGGPQHWPFAWVGCAKDLRCRFRNVPAQQRRWLECEQVADFPEIELHILTCPGEDPVLAEVAFPPAMSIVQAKQYIFQELQELPVQASGGRSHWTEDAKGVSLVLGETSPAEAISIELEPGICEVVFRSPRPGSRDEVCWHTHRLEFAKDSGWNFERATAWADRHLPRSDSPRTALLQVPYRMAPALAEFLSDAIFGGGYTVTRGTGGQKPAGFLTPDPSPLTPDPSPLTPIIFIPVPALKKAEQGTLDLPKGGAGLELDLTTARCTDRLPPDLRTNLPTKGFVNYPEARSVVRKLEELVRDARERGLTCSGMAVVALYAGQVELIRGLIKRSEPLRQSLAPIEVGMPFDFTHREFPIVLLSLTRSHSHRAVTFAEEFSHLALAMTRARSQLYLFGDAGTLVHRSRSAEANGRAEQQAISALVQYLQGLGKHSQAFQLCGSE